MSMKPLDDIIRGALRQTSAHHNKRLIEPSGSEGAFAAMVLAEFDRVNAQALVREFRILSGAETGFSNVALPASYQREVIRQALTDLNILNLVRVATDSAAMATTEIPYEERSAASIPNDGIVYEGQGIPFAGVGLKRDTAYIQAMKLALKVTNEVIHFSQASGINWDAWGDSIATNARVIRELISLRITNEMQRAADSFNAVHVTGEAFTASADGVIKTAQFPIVRPHQARDLQGNAIGNPENPLVITINGTAIPYFINKKDLPAGTYWTFSNINLGYIQLVNQLGQVTGDGSEGTISYSTATNLFKFDIQAPVGTKYTHHLNDLLTAIGDRKAVLSGQRYARPDYAVMSYMLNNEVTKAEQFVASMRRDGTATTLQGDLDMVKGLPVFDTNAPGDFGDMRILLGQRGLTGYTIAKPYSMGAPFEATDSNGYPTGEKIAYGEEYSAIHTPKPVRNRYTSVLVYDSTTR
ncbi:MAG: hypothetical protein L3K52_15205 [Candidatus Thiothrix sulfatifontis]|nr:MAG: hypothetical protein L3K52_15205 [Candidatus Thiothrix sulfatifontis]